MKKNNPADFFVLLRNFFTKYLIIRRNFSPKTVKTYKQSFRQLIFYFKSVHNVRFDQIDLSYFTRNNIYDFLIWLQEYKSNKYSTINLRLSAIKSFLKFCSEEDFELTSNYLEISSIRAFKNLKVNRVEYLTQNQLKILFTIPDVSNRLDRRNRFMMIFIYETGCRLQEALDLKISSIIFCDKIIKIRITGKGGKIRYIPLLGDTIQHLQSYIDEFHSKQNSDDFLFYTIHRNQHTQMQPGTVHYFLKKYCKIACEVNRNFPLNLHAHMLRHSIAMGMYKSGVPISYIKDFLGHSSIETTSIYAYADEETIAGALETVNNDLLKNLPNSVKKKNWKDKEDDLMEYCGLK